jgi:midasin (ATPase involved in ribosome maturation)
MLGFHWDSNPCAFVMPGNLDRQSSRFSDAVGHFISGLPALQSTTLNQAKADILSRVRSTLLSLGVHGRFEWVDGPLVQALREGHWVVLDGANLCSPSVLDRLNSLCESDGVLACSTKGVALTEASRWCDLILTSDSSWPLTLSTANSLEQ